MKLIFRKKEYQTFSHCYKDNKHISVVSLATFVKRIRQGWSVEESLTKPKDLTHISHRGSHNVEGVVYPNLPSIARAYGFSEWIVYRRYYNGFRGDELVPLKKRKSYVPPEPKKSAFQVEIGGVIYKSRAEACRILGVAEHTYKNRSQRGATLEECFNIEPYKDGRKTRAKTFEYKGELLTFKDIQNRFGLYQGTFLSRLEKGLSVEEALTKKSRRKNKLTRTEGD